MMESEPKAPKSATSARKRTASSRKNAPSGGSVPARKAATKTAARKTIAKSAPSRKKTTRKATAARLITVEERRRLIAEAAYLRAEARGFTGGSPEEDWVKAEAEVDARLLDRGIRTE